ncbi:hypothetical protein NQ314_012807 [Rhamnusium bicolor]|uniref:Uncharacterized protein n=1 Tax=Rhamnusium bicolor TaxID=1586634 RepID=A0AAV8XAA9_9CUCU|nr:hypothetical protein NQ314_012807 [Rhamnusium bicolor]
MTLKIMKNGRFEKEGTISDLKKEFGGFSIKLKLTNKNHCRDENASSTKVNDIDLYDEVDAVPLIENEDINDSPQFDTMDELKDYFINEYGGEIKDEHSVSLCKFIYLYISFGNPAM